MQYLLLCEIVLLQRGSLLFKKMRFWSMFFLAVTLCVLLMPRCRDGHPGDLSAAEVPAFDQQRAFADLEYQVDAGYRVPGSAVHRQVRDWLQEQLAAQSDEVHLQPFTHKLGGRDVEMWNIIALFPGTGGEDAEHVLLAAHWDTRPTADKETDPLLQKKPIPGANDGASGVAVLLEIARQLKANPIERTVEIVLFDGEDYGPKIDNMLLGAKYYAANLPKKRADWGVLLDMVGDRDLQIYREPNSDLYARKVNGRIFNAAKMLNFSGAVGIPGFYNSPGKYNITDDHIPINEAGIPMVDVIDFDYPPWHTLQDNVEQCDPQSLFIVGTTILMAIRIK